MRVGNNSLALVGENDNSLVKVSSPPSAVCPEGILPLLPVEDIMKILVGYCMVHEIDEDDPMGSGETFDMLKPLYDFSNEALIFGDWRFYIVPNIQYQNDMVEIEVIAQKKNVHMMLSVRKQSFMFEPGCWEDIDESNIIFDQWGCPCLKAIFVLNIIEAFFRSVNYHSIKQWNDICINMPPIIDEEPPFFILLRDIMENIYNILTDDYESHVEYAKGNDEPLLYESLGYYMECSLNCPGCWLELGINWNDGAELIFGDWVAYFDIISDENHTSDLDGGNNHYCRFYIARAGLDVQFLLWEEIVTWTSYDELTLDEFEEGLDENFEDFLNIVIQWNELMEKSSKGGTYS